MKLIGTDYGGRAESLGAESKLRSAKNWGHALEALGDTAMRWADAKDQESFQNEANEYLIEKSKLDLQLRAPYQESKNLPPELAYEQTEEKWVNGQKQTIQRTQIPTYEVQTPWYDNFHAQADAKAKAKLSAGAYKKWKSWFAEQSLADRTRNGIAQFDAAQAAEKARLDEQVETLKDFAKYEDAVIAIDGSPYHTPKEKAEKREALLEAGDADPILDALRDDDLVRLEQSREALDNPLLTPNLSAKQRTILDNQVRTRIRQLTSTKKAGVSAYEKQLKQKAKTLITALDSGYSAESVRGEVQSVVDQLIATGNEKQASELLESISTNGLIASITALPLEERITALNTLEQIAETPESYLQVQRVRNGVEKNTKDIRDDTFGTMQKEDPKLYKPLDFNNLGASLAQRMNQARLVQEQKGFVDSYISEEETELLNENVSQMSTNEQMELFNTVQTAMGPESRKIWEKTKLSKSVPAISYAGELYSLGAKQASQGVLRGNNILKDTPDFLKNHRVDMENDGDWQDALTTYPAGPQRTAYLEAIRSRYADFVNQKGEGSFSSDSLEAAIKDVSREVVTYAGASFVNPMPQVLTAARFEEFMDDLSPEYISRLGKPVNVTPEQLANGLSDKGWIGTDVKFNLKPVARNAFYIAFADRTDAFVMEELVDPQTGKIVTRPFRFYYDPNIQNETLPIEELPKVNRRGRPINQDRIEQEPVEEPVLEEKPRFDRRGRPINRGLD